MGALGVPPPMIPGGYPRGPNTDEPPKDWRDSFLGPPVENKAACAQQGGSVYFSGSKCCFWSDDKNEYRCNRIYSTAGVDDTSETPAQTSEFYNAASALTANQYSRPGAFPGQYPTTYPGQYPTGYPGQYQAGIGGIDTSTLLIGGAIMLGAYLLLNR